MPEIFLDYRSPAELKPRARAFRTHPEAQIVRLCQSIREYGFIEPVLIDGGNRIVCGAAMVEAAKRIGLNRIPIVRVDHLSETQLRSYAIAANKLADMAGYDEAELALELADIQAMIGGLELPELGISTPELDRILGLASKTVELDAIPEVARDKIVSRKGELWTMGTHALLVGDALDSVSYLALMAGELAQSVISDLPYNRATDSFSTTRQIRISRFTVRDFSSASKSPRFCAVFRGSKMQLNHREQSERNRCPPMGPRFSKALIHRFSCMPGSRHSKPRALRCSLQLSGMFVMPLRCATVRVAG